MFQTLSKSRKCARGANLAMLCATGAMIIGFMGIAIYTGLQSFIEGDLQRVTMNAAMAGAAAYYGDVGTGGRPSPNAGNAKQVAEKVFNAISNNTSLGGFSPTVTTSNNDANDSITVKATASIALPFLAPIGLSTFKTETTATARALRYEPTLFTGEIKILPKTGDLASYARTMTLKFPLVDGPGNDLYVEMDPATQRGYIVEACDDSQCYSLVDGATPVGTSQILTPPTGVKTIYGTAIIDLKKAGVSKASKLRFTHANEFTSYNAGAKETPADPTAEMPVIIKRVMLFGYAGACVDDKNCPIPAGFMPVE